MTHPAEPSDLDKFVDLLLATPQRAERQALLKEWAMRHGLNLSFFQKVKDRVLAIKNDPPVQRRLAQIIEDAMPLTNDPHSHAMAMWAKSLTAVFQELWPEAIAIAEDAMRRYQQLGNHEAFGILGANQVMNLARMDRLTEADNLAANMVNYLLPLEQPALLARVYRHWAMVKLDQHQPEDALRLMNLARPFIWEADNPWRMAAFLGDLAPILLLLDRYVEAADSLSLAEAYFRQAQQPYDWATTAHHLAELYQKMGRLGDALAMADEAIALYWEVDSADLTYARAVLRQAGILLDLNQPTQALIQLQSIRDKLATDTEKMAEAALIEGIALVASGYMPQAEAHLQWCITNFAVQFPYFVLTARFTLAQLYLTWGTQTKDVAKFHAGLELATQLHTELQEKRPIRAAEAGHLIAQFLLMLGRQSDAQAWLEYLADHAYYTLHLQVQHQHLLAQLAHQTGDWATARFHYEHTLALLNQLRTQFHLEEIQISMMSGQEKLYKSLLDVCLAQSDWEAVWATSEKARAYSLTAALARETLIAFSSKADDEDSHGRQTVVDALYNTRARRFSLCSQLYVPTEADAPLSTLPLEKEAAIRQQIRALDDELTHLYQQLHAAQAAQLNPHRSVTVSSIQEVAAYLPDDTLLLIYTRLAGRLLVMGVAASGMVIQEVLQIKWREVERPLAQFIHIGLQELRDAWASFGAAGVQKRFNHFLASAQEQLHQLYCSLWQPIAHFLAGYGRIVIVPQDILHYVPFQALYSGTDYLIDRHVISYAPSASLYVLCRQRANARRGQWGKDVVLLAYQGHENDLGFVEQEVTHIQQAYPGANMLLGEAATLDNLRRQVASARILHLATHGKTSNRSPFLSHLELAGKHNEQLRVYDAAQLNLRQTDLVCLSACETGQVADRGGDLLGLQWGFLHAGAYALLANQWPVDDAATARLMGDFYGRYRPQDGKAVALRDAQLALRHQDDWRLAHPYYWAPFAVYGFAGPIA